MTQVARARQPLQCARENYSARDTGGTESAPK